MKLAMAYPQPAEAQAKYQKPQSHARRSAYGKPGDKIKDFRGKRDSHQYQFRKTYDPDLSGDVELRIK